MAKAKAKAKAQSLISPVGIAHWLHVWKPQVNEENPDQDPKFSVTLVFKKSVDIAYLEKALLKAAIGKFKDKAKGMIAKGKLSMPIRDGDEEVDEKTEKPKYKGCWFIVAKTTQRPGVVDQDREPIEDQFDLYAGCKVRLSLFPFAYDIKGNKGVTFMLNNVQKIADGDRLSGRASAEDDFDDGETYGDDEDEDEEDDTPVRGKAKAKAKKSKSSRDEDEDDEDEEEEEEEEEDEDEPPARSKAKSKAKAKSKKSRVEDEDEDEEDDEDEDDEEEDDPRRR